MLRSLNIKNFKSFKDTTLELSPFTLMIGANASGKSNAIEALQCVSWLSKSSVSGFSDEGKKLIRDFERITSPKIVPISLDVEYNCNKQLYKVGFVKRKKSALVSHESLSDTTKKLFSKGKQNFETFICELGVISTMKEIRENPQAANPFSIDNKMINERFEEEPLYEAREVFIRNIKSCKVLDVTPQFARGYISINSDILSENAENLSAVLYKLCHDKKDGKNNREIILSTIQSLPEQRITEIKFIKTENDDVMVGLSENFGGKDNTFYASALSDGTLRVLAIVAFILSNPKGSLLVIEEIDNGIHPSRIKNFLDRIRELAKEREIQILMTSHNPALLDAIPRECIKDVVCCYRDKDDGDSRLVRLGDLHRYPQLVARGSLGELLTQGIVDKFVHDKRTPEEMKKQALDWLDDFKKELEEI